MVTQILAGRCAMQCTAGRFEWTFITSASQSVMVQKSRPVGVAMAYMPLPVGFERTFITSDQVGL